MNVRGERKTGRTEREKDVRRNGHDGKGERDGRERERRKGDRDGKNET